MQHVLKNIWTRRLLINKVINKLTNIWTFFKNTVFQNNANKYFRKRYARLNANYKLSECIHIKRVFSFYRSSTISVVESFISFIYLWTQYISSMKILLDDELPLRREKLQKGWPLWILVFYPSDIAIVPDHKVGA